MPEAQPTLDSLRGVIAEVFSMDVEAIPSDPETRMLDIVADTSEDDVIEAMMLAEDDFGVNIDHEKLESMVRDSRGLSSYGSLTIGALFGLLQNGKVRE